MDFKKLSLESSKTLVEQYKKELSASKMLKLIFYYIHKITNEKDLNKLLILTADMGKDIILAERCSLWLIDADKKEVWTKVAHGIDEIRMSMDDGIVGEVIRTAQPILTDDPYRYTYFNPSVDQKTGYLTKSILAIPLMDNASNVIGVYQALNKTNHDSKFTEQDIEYLSLAASYAAKSIESAMLYKEIEDTQKELIVTMGAIGENRSKETANHVRRVAEYSKLLALKHGLPFSEAELLKLASPMHDIGKVGIPDMILNKQGKLSNDEFELIKKHTELGYQLLAGSSRKILKTAAIVAHQHHEKFNGTGYPQGLKGKDIHVYGRITALADVFDALGSDRCYKKAWPTQNIIELFKEEKNEHFDSELVDIFLENINEFLQIRDAYSDDDVDGNIDSIIKALNKFTC